MTPRLLLLFITALFAIPTCFAQSDSAWHHIDTSIRNKRNLQDMRAIVLQWKEQAIEKQDHLTTARCFRSLVQISDKTTEDTLFFKNGLLFDSVLRSASSPPLLKALMHMMKAKRIDEFRTRFQHTNIKTLFHSYDATIDYAALSQNELDSVISSHFDVALQLLTNVTQPSGQEILWLSSTPLNVSAFKPDLADIIYVERIVSRSNGPSLQASREVFDLLALPQQDFISVPSLPAASFQLDTIFRYYKQWMEYHRQQPPVYYYIETLARKHVYYRVSSDSTAVSVYEQYLQSLLRSPWSIVKAHAVYQLCLLWSNEAANYNPDPRSGYYLYGSKRTAIDSTYRLHFVKALKLFEEYSELLDSFSVFNRQLISLKAQIQTPGLQIELENVQIPGKPVLAMLRFRNIVNLHTEIVRLNAFETLPEKLEDKLARLSKMHVVRTAVQPFPPLNDYQWHNAFVKLDPLPVGRYFILYSNEELTDTNKDIEFVEISVTNIAVVNNDDRVFVLDRETGFPLQNARVTTARRVPVAQGFDTVWASSPKIVNKEGYVYVNTEHDSFLKAHFNDDSIVADINDPYFNLPEGFYDKEQYEDILEYYEDNTKLHMFTDRSIYRPGQTVHYKGIFLIPDPKTGEWVVLNWKNLKLSFFKKLFFKISLKLTKEKIEVEVTDPVNETFKTLEVMPDKFGSFSGSFTIPSDAATGEYEFECLDIYTDSENRGTFHVEEYKRPTMELVLEKPTRELYLRDSFEVKAKVKSFAGANLDRVLVKYRVNVSGRLPAPGDIVKYRNEEILVGQAYTDNEGSFSIKVIDSVLLSLTLPPEERWNFSYEIEVQAVDPSGESQEETLQLQLSTRPVSFDVNLPSVLERKAIAPIYILPKSPFAGPVQKQVQVRLYRQKTQLRWDDRFDWLATDVELYSRQEFNEWFPQIDLDVLQADSRELVMDTTMLAGGDDKLPMPPSLLVAGEYQMEITCVERGHITGEWKRNFSVYDEAANQLPGPTTAFDHLPVNSVRHGEKIKWMTGNSVKDIFSIYHIAYYKKNRKGIAVKYEYSITHEKKGLNHWEFPVPADAIGNMLVTHIYILNNHLIRLEKTIFIEGKTDTRPEIIVQQYRTKLTPGQKETFSVSIKTRNENVLAQLMTTMYDATLDKLVPHRWDLPQEKLYLYIENSWNREIAHKVTGYLPFKTLPERARRSDLRFGWLNPGDYKYGAVYDPYGSDLAISYNLFTAPSVQVDNMRLDEVVVVGYGSVKRNLAGAVSGITIRGQASLKSYQRLPVIIDGVLFEGDISTIDVNSIVQGIVFSGADATAIYGSRAADGILLLSTKGPVQLPAAPPPPAPVIRKNFSETAFFYPRIYADRDGYYTIQFTLPESVTTWKWKMLAHTKHAVFAYHERQLYSQLPLMIQPDMPRFLYQGDKLVLKSRITNLDSVDCNGILDCVIEDAVTGEDISKQIISLAKKDFSVTRLSNSTGSFDITIPENLLHPLKIRITATSKSYADGEEHIIPVMAKKLLVSQTVPVVIQQQTKTEIATPSLPADAIPYGVSLFITPKSQAAMVNSLPWLANYPYDCAEQTLNKLLASTIAVSMMRKDTAIGQSIANAKRRAKENADSLPGELHEETMPWLQLNKRHLLQQKQLLALFDTLEVKVKMVNYFDQLADMQNPDGGMSWFQDGKSDPYISNYIMAGFGKIEKEKLPFPENSNSSYRYASMISKLVKYCDEQFSGQVNALHYLYGRSFWIGKFPLSQSQRVKIDSILNKYWENPQRTSIGRQALLITVTSRLLPPENPLRRKALEQLESIRQAAIRDEINGIRWKELADADDLDTRSEEWVVRIAEAFEENGDKATVPGIITWLLRARNEHNWSSTKATADVINLFNRQPSQTGMKSLSLKATIDTATLLVTDDLFSGRSIQFTNISGRSFPVSITVAGQENVFANGGINYYFLTEQPPVLKEKDKVNITKKLYRFNSQTSVWEELTPGIILKAGDKIQTRLTIFAPRLLQYVFIDEKRAAACEPADASSGYEYGQDITYYKSVRDAGYQFFAEKIPAGTSSISYETIVSKTGIFNYGPAILQCMYQPDLRTWSNSYTLEVKE